MDSPVASTSSDQEATEGTTRMTDKLFENLVMLKANKYGSKAGNYIPKANSLHSIQ